jgi:hypothetical protein
MNYTPLDSSFQCASFESKKCYLASSYTITRSNLVRIGDKNVLKKNHVPPLLSHFHFGKSFKRP